MQEGIHAAVFRQVIALDIALVFEQRLILAVQPDHAEGNALEVRQRRAGAVLLPGIEKKPACFVAGWIEHGAEIRGECF